MKIQSYRDLKVWQLGIELVDDIYEITSGFPKTEHYGLAQQMRRCAVSIPSNIAEGSARTGTKELIQFVSIARGSLAELETQIIIAYRRQYITDDQYGMISEKSETINKMLVRLQQSLWSKAA